MAGKGSTTTTPPDAPPAPPDEESFVEVSLPEGLTLEDFEQKPPAEETPPPTPAEPTPPAPTPTAAPAAVVPPTPPPPAAPAGEEKKGDLGKALKKEREKTKRLTRENRNLWEDVQRQRQDASQKLVGRPAPADIAVTTDIPKVASEFAKKESLDGQAEVVLREAQRFTQDAIKRVQESVGSYLWQVQEAEFREEHEDYDEVLREAGIWDATQQDAQGNFRDPLVARVIYSSANPAKRAYKLAQDKLRAEGKRQDPDDAEDSVTESAALPPGQPAASPTIAPAPPAPAPAPATPEALAEAERRGARQVIESAEVIARKPQGVRVLRNAGEPPRVGLTRDFGLYLEQLMDRQPDKFLEFASQNPEVDRWFMEGTWRQGA